LDAEHKERMIALLEGFETQIFITCVEPSILETSKNKKMFHVEHGMIKEVL
jgi:DNA replication and repair protein RecF